MRWKRIRGSVSTFYTEAAHTSNNIFILVSTPTWILKHATFVYLPKRDLQNTVLLKLRIKIMLSA